MKVNSVKRRILALIIALATLTLASCTSRNEISSEPPSEALSSSAAPSLKPKLPPPSSSSKSASSQSETSPPPSAEEDTVPDSPFEEPYLPPESMPEQPSTQEGGSHKPIINLTQILYDYLEDNLSPDDYASTDIGWSDSGSIIATIWCTKQENVVAVVEDYIASVDYHFEVTYMEAKRSLTELSPILADVQAQFSETGGMWIGIAEDVVGITLYGPSQSETEDILAWWNGYKYKDYVTIEIAPDSPFANPTQLTPKSA